MATSTALGASRFLLGEAPEDGRRGGGESLRGTPSPPRASPEGDRKRPSGSDLRSAVGVKSWGCLPPARSQLLTPRGLGAAWRPGTWRAELPLFRSGRSRVYCFLLGLAGPAGISPRPRGPRRRLGAQLQRRLSPTGLTVRLSRPGAALGSRRRRNRAPERRVGVGRAVTAS